MTCVFYLTLAFYSSLALAFLIPWFFVYSYWRGHKFDELDWITHQSRDMYVDAYKTLINASGIVVGLAIGSAFSAQRSATTDPLIVCSAKVAVFSLLVCIFVSFVGLLALLRGFELAQSRNLKRTGDGSQGQLSATELLFILIPTGFALSSFVVALFFLGRVVYHF
jgi:hypothetical protein